MRRIAPLAFLVVFLLAAAPTAVANHSDLVLQWHLDDRTNLGGDAGYTTLDSSGHNLYGYSNQGTQLVPGRFGSAYEFFDPMGSTQKGVQVQDSVLEPQQVTVMVWVRRSASPGFDRYVVAKGGGGCISSSYALYTGPSAGLHFYVRQGTTAQVAPSIGPEAIWDGNWHAVAGTFDGATVRLYVDGAEVGGGTPAPGSIAYGLADSSFWLGKYPQSGSSCGFATDFTGFIDEARVYNRALSATEIANLQGPGAAPGPDLPPDPGRPPPQVTDVTQLPAPGDGAPALLTAAVSGPYNQIEWNLRGDDKPELTSGVGETTVRFRPTGGTATVGVRAVGPGGPGPLKKVNVSKPKGLRGSTARKVEGVLVARPLDAAGPVGTMERTTTKEFNCSAVQSPIRASAGILDISGGCMAPISSLDDIPAADRGFVEQLARQYGIPLQKDAVQTAIRLSDGYLSRGAVTINGVTFTPASNAAVVVFPQVNAIVSSSAALSIGNLKLDGPRRFILNTGLQNGGIPLGDFSIAGNSLLKKLAAFDLVGDVKVRLRGAGGGAPKGAEITANLRLPPFLRVFGSDLQTKVTLQATTDRGLILDGLHIGPLDADLGALAVKKFRLDYTGSADEWRGSGIACVPTGQCLDMIPPNGSVVIRSGELYFAGASLSFPPPGVPLFPGLNMERIGFGIGLNPTRFTGNAKVVALKLYEIDGRLVLAFPSAATPFRLDSNEVGGGFPPNFYGQQHTQATIGITANASLRTPIGPVGLGNGYFLYEYPGYVAFGGGVNQGFAGVVSIQGSVTGEFNLNNGRFNLIGNTDACLIGVLCRGATGLISSRGLSACLHLGIVSIGGGVVYSPFDITVWPLDGCKWSPFAERSVRASGTGGAHTVTIGAGDPSRVIRLQGVTDAPRVKVTGPGGQSLESPPGSGFVMNRSLRIIRSESTKLTVVGLQDPAAGTYRIEPLPGSPAVAHIAEAQDPPDARVTARVSGSGATRVLAYSILRRPGQKVTFTEIAGNARRSIGTVNGGGRGRLRFSPAPGRGVRTIEAQFELNGLPAERKIVARFAPPSARLARPARLRVRRLGTSLRVSWASVVGAATYEVVTTTTGAGQRTRRTRGRSLTVRGISKSSSGRVTVRAIARLRQGAPASARFRATAPRRTRFGRLARPPRLR